MTGELPPILQLFKDALEQILPHKEEGQGFGLKVQMGDTIIEAGTIPQPRAGSRGGRRPQYRHPAGDPKPQVISKDSVKTYLERTKLPGVDQLEYQENEQGVLVKPKRFLDDLWPPINQAIRGGLSGSWERDAKGWVVPK